jgi:hypothetical protein
MSGGVTLAEVLTEVAHGLHRWTARHPAWEAGAEPGSPGDWPEEVGSVAYEGPDALVLVDPMIEDWEPLDALVERHGRPVAVLTTMRFHGRSRAAVAERYGATLVSHADPHPAGVARVPIEGADESMVWVEAPAALVPGDRLIGGDGTPPALRMCPESWLGYLPGPPGADDLRAALLPLLELPVELVLVSHGEPVLRDGAAALRAALG